MENPAPPTSANPDPASTASSIASVAGDEHLHCWEKTKENVLPSKRGRSITSLRTFAMNEHDSGRDQMIETQRRAFESAVEGSDELKPWLLYLKWTQQTFPNQGPGSGILSILERCCNTFQADARYENHLPYLKVWIMYVEVTENPEDIFRYLHKHKIFADLSLFYICWAYSVEMDGNTPRADKIYQFGIQRGAKPQEPLKLREKQFQRRVLSNWRKAEAAKAAGLVEGGAAEDGAAADGRSALGGVARRRGRSTENDDQTNGRQASRRGGAGGLRSRGGDGPGGAPPVAGGRKGGNFLIFVDPDLRGGGGGAAGGGAAADDLDSDPLLAGGADDVAWNDLGTEAERAKENTTAPAVWTESGLAGGAVRDTGAGGRRRRGESRDQPSAVVETRAPVAFEVFEEEDMAGAKDARGAAAAEKGHDDDDDKQHVPLRQRLERGLVAGERLAHNPLLNIRHQQQQEDTVEEDEEEEEEKVDAGKGVGGDYGDVSSEESGDDAVAEVASRAPAGFAMFEEEEDVPKKRQQKTTQDQAREQAKMQAVNLAAQVQAQAAKAQAAKAQAAVAAAEAEAMAEAKEAAPPAARKSRASLSPVAPKALFGAGKGGAVAEKVSSKRGGGRASQTKKTKAAGSKAKQEAIKEKSSGSQKRVLMYDPELLAGEDGEVFCFEEARAMAWAASQPAAQPSPAAPAAFAVFNDVEDDDMEEENETKFGINADGALPPRGKASTPHSKVVGRDGRRRSRPAALVGGVGGVGGGAQDGQGEGDSSSSDTDYESPQRVSPHGAAPAQDGDNDGREEEEDRFAVQTRVEPHMNATAADRDDMTLNTRGAVSMIAQADGEDMTINTRLALQDLDDIFCTSPTSHGVDSSALSGGAGAAGGAAGASAQQYQFQVALSSAAVVAPGGASSSGLDENDCNAANRGGENGNENNTGQRRGLGGGLGGGRLGQRGGFGGGGLGSVSEVGDESTDEPWAGGQYRPAPEEFTILEDRAGDQGGRRRGEGADAQQDAVLSTRGAAGGGTGSGDTEAKENSTPPEGRSSRNRPSRALEDVEDDSVLAPLALDKVLGMDRANSPPVCSGGGGGAGGVGGGAAGGGGGQDDGDAYVDEHGEYEEDGSEEEDLADPPALRGRGVAAPFSVFADEEEDAAEEPQQPARAPFQVFEEGNDAAVAAAAAAAPAASRGTDATASFSGIESLLRDLDDDMGDIMAGDDDAVADLPAPPETNLFDFDDDEIDGVSEGGAAGGVGGGVGGVMGGLSCIAENSGEMDSTGSSGGGSGVRGAGGQFVGGQRQAAGAAGNVSARSGAMPSFSIFSD
jgi:hypothetical protein